MQQAPAPVGEVPLASGERPASVDALGPDDYTFIADTLSKPQLFEGATGEASDTWKANQLWEALSVLMGAEMVVGLGGFMKNVLELLAAKNETDKAGITTDMAFMALSVTLSGLALWKAEQKKQETAAASVSAPTAVATT